MAVQRDAKGHFIKGNTEGRKFQSGGTAAAEGSKGGVASKKAEAERKTFRDIIQTVLNTEQTNPKGERATVREIVTLQLVSKAMKGDTSAIQMVVKISGEWPTEKRETIDKTPKGITFADADKETVEIARELSNRKAKEE